MPVFDNMPTFFADKLFTAELLVKKFNFECLEVRSGPPKLWVLLPPDIFVGSAKFIKLLKAHHLRCKIEGRPFPYGTIELDIPEEGIHEKVYVGDPP